MSVSEQIKILCVKLNISVAELARKCGKSPQAFSQQMKRESFSHSDLLHIAKCSGCDFECCFILPNGDRVSF